MPRRDPNKVVSMYNEIVIPLEIVSDERLTPMEKLILGVILTEEKFRGRPTQISNTEISKKTRTEKRNVWRILKKLESKGYLKTEKAGKEEIKQGISNSYFVM